jgi:hypothetical protein
MASAILMLLYPRRYGVIDIRVWQLLHTVGSVRKAPSGVGFSFNNWYQFLMIIRYFAQKHGVKARDIERTLFLVHRHFKMAASTLRSVEPRLSYIALHPTAAGVIVSGRG